MSTASRTWLAIKAALERELQMIDELEMLSHLGLNKFVSKQASRRGSRQAQQPRQGHRGAVVEAAGLFEIPRQGVTLLGGYSRDTKKARWQTSGHCTRRTRATRSVSHRWS